MKSIVGVAASGTQSALGTTVLEKNLIELVQIETDSPDNPYLPPEAMVEFEGLDLFVKLLGVRIAKRQDKTWIALEPGYTVRDHTEPNQIEVEFVPVIRQ